MISTSVFIKCELSRRLGITMFVLCIATISAQNIYLKGNIIDSTQNTGIANVVLTIQPHNDSTQKILTNTRAGGAIIPVAIPSGPCLLIVSHISYKSKRLFIVPRLNDTIISLTNIFLAPVAQILDEIQVLSQAEKIYHKGDTVIFTADSFKTDVGVPVEELLKRLPGVKIDIQGGIIYKEKKVGTLLVNGESFFGNDPTIATRNINASSIRNVQVYEVEKTNSVDGRNELVRVVNLNFKSEANNGYLGKVSCANDFRKFYKNEMLLCKFRNEQRLSVFSSLGNTPGKQFNSQSNSISNDDPVEVNREKLLKGGIPHTLNTGFTFGNRLNTCTKLNVEYFFSDDKMKTIQESYIQYYLPNTEYKSTQSSIVKTQDQKHDLNVKLTHKLDLLTQLIVIPKIKYSLRGTETMKTADFFSEYNRLFRSTLTGNSLDRKVLDVNVFIELIRSFNRRGRMLTITFQPTYVGSNSSTNMGTVFNYFDANVPDSNINQKSEILQLTKDQNVTFTYIEPLTKHLKTEITYMLLHSINKLNRTTFNISDQGSDRDSGLSNDVKNVRFINQTGVRLTYNIRKCVFSAGSNLQQSTLRSSNLTDGKNSSISTTNPFFFGAFMYKIKKASDFSINYNGSYRQPDLTQLQPVIDITDPNRILLGNPQLKAAFVNICNLNYYIDNSNDDNFNLGLTGTVTKNQFSYASNYDSLGGLIVQPINLNGNYYGNIYFGGRFSVKPKGCFIEYKLSSDVSNNASVVNNQINKSKNMHLTQFLCFGRTTSLFDFNLEANYTYAFSKTGINIVSAQRYYTYNLGGNLIAKLPRNFSFNFNVIFFNNGNRPSGYNLNYLVANASLKETFLKSRNLTFSFEANDIFNRSINMQRYVNGNEIIDTKIQIIRRYFLFKIIFRFKKN